MRRKWEKGYPYILTLFVGVSFFCILKSYPDFEINSNLYAAALSLFGVLLGFLSTTKAILMGVQSHVILKLQEKGLMKDLLGYLKVSVWACFIACIVNILAFFINTEASELFHYYSLIWVVISAFALTAFFRITKIMLKILLIHYETPSATDASNKQRGKATPTE